MGGGHLGSHRLHVEGSSVLHRAAPEAKIAALVVFVVCVAFTPRRAVPAFAVDAAVVATAVGIAGVRWRVVAARLVVIAPFVVSAALVPFVAGGERVDVVGLSLSVEGLWGAFNVAAKALIGAGAAIAVSATTRVPDLLAGLSRLRVPAPLVSIAAFMFRYTDLCLDQLGRMRRAMAARGHEPRWLWQARPTAAALGTAFVRSYERGERVHAAMVARGFSGAVPDTGRVRWATGRDWATVAVAPVVAAVALIVATLT